MAPSLYRQIAEESESWTKEGLITPEQRTAILGRYEETSAPAVPANELPLFIRALLILACVLIGAAVLLVVSFNWAALPGAAKLSIVIGGWLASGLAGFGLRRTARKMLAEAVFFLCGIMFGVAVWQIGQVFHLPADFPLGFLIWGTGVFLLAVTLASTAVKLCTESNRISSRKEQERKLKMRCEVFSPLFVKEKRDPASLSTLSFPLPARLPSKPFKS